jgi:hypothetical protein
LICAALIPAGAARAEKDSNQALVEMLVRKGILTQQDVDDLKKELADGEAVKPAVVVPPPSAPPLAPSAPEAQAAVVEKRGASPLSFKVGAADFTPFGFADFTTVCRTTNVGSGISTNFGGIPYGNTSAGQLSETRFSAQNSRLGLRVDSKVNDTNVLGYVETDFLGNAAGSLNVTSNSATLRMRLYFADFRQGDWELLAGQSWSMMTPNRTGISPIPGDLFYTMDMDIAYQEGLVWARQPQVRVVFHATDEFTAGLSLENPDPYIGGVNGAGTSTLPPGFNAAEVDSGSASAAPSRIPDVIGKLAYDTEVNDLPWHAEIAGLYSSFSVNSYAPGTPPVNADSSANGFGGALNADLEVVKGLSLVATSYLSDGGGRYIFGQAPDFTVSPQEADGACEIRGLRSWSLVAGLEWRATPMTALFGYASKVGIGRQFEQQANRSYVGYGYPGSPNSQNRAVDELTLGASHTFWKDPALGALMVIAQASYVEREPWYVAQGTPADAHTGMFFLDLRYVLP